MIGELVSMERRSRRMVSPRTMLLRMPRMCRPPRMLSLARSRGAKAARKVAGCQALKPFSQLVEERLWYTTYLQDA